jgi:IS5 family transposase
MKLRARFQQTLASQSSFAKYGRKGRRQLFLGQTNQVVPWSELLAMVAPVYPKAGNGQQMVGLSITLRTYFCNSVLTFLIPASRKRFMIPQYFSAWREWT